MIKLSELLDLMENDTFVSIIWVHTIEYCYQGPKDEYYDIDDDMVVINISNSRVDGIILKIDVDDSIK